ncbi:MAG TPA: hypothetical protein VMA73_24285 [Streptosporangiaceae bacterium]|nr:hypothetical protein [Streptosporangiaceae bacterium]
MKNHSCWQFRGWRSRGSGRHAGARQTPELAQEAAPASGTGGRRDDGGVGEIRACETRARQTRAGGAAAGDTVAAAMQMAIGLLTASLDSPELEARVLPVLIPPDADGLGDLMAGLHLVSELVIHELHEATGEDPEAILQRLAILAEYRRGTPSAG